MGYVIHVHGTLKVLVDVEQHIVLPVAGLDEWCNFLCVTGVIYRHCDELSTVFLLPLVVDPMIRLELLNAWLTPRRPETQDNRTRVLGDFCRIDHVAGSRLDLHGGNRRGLLSILANQDVGSQCENGEKDQEMSRHEMFLRSVRFVVHVTVTNRQIMKTHVLALILGLALACSAQAQTFTIDWAKPNPIKGTPDGGTVKRDGTVRNLNDVPKELYFSYDLNDLFIDHTAQLCMTLCWALFPGPGDDPFEREGQILAANGTLPIYVDLTPRGAEGTSKVRVTLFDKTNQTERLNFDVVFEISPSSSVIDAQRVGVTVSPLPAADQLTLRGDAIAALTTLGLYDASGSLVRSFATPSSTVATLPTAGLANGTYRLVMRTAAGELVGAPVVISR